MNYIIFFLFIFGVFIGGISNYYGYSFFLKIGISFILLILMFAIGIKDKINFLKDKEFRKLLILLFIIVIYLFITVLYSIGFEFGLKKIFYFLASNVVVIVFSYFLFKYKYDFIISKGIYFLISFGLLSVPVIMILAPFNFGTIYKFEVSRWSHVFYGRFIGSVFLIWFIIVFFSKENLNTIIKGTTLNFYNKYRYLINSFFLIILAYGVYLSGLRASILSILVIMISVFLFDLIRKKLNITKIIYFVICVATILGLIYFYTPADKIMEFRYKSLFGISNDFSEKEMSIVNRMDAQKLALKMFSERPLFGYGLGSFYSYEDSDYYRIIKYPHNIFLEAAAEMGLLGILVFAGLISLILRGVYKFSPLFLLYFIYPLILTFFSKDIPTQTMFWIGIAFIFIKNNPANKIHNR